MDFGETQVSIAVTGMWHLGPVVAGCLASVGYDVQGFDSNSEIIDMLNKGKLPVSELGLKELIWRGKIEGLLHFTSDPSEVAQSSLIWVTYDTPVDGEDRADTGFVVDSVKALFPHLKEGVLVIISSQLPVGSTAYLEREFMKCRPDVKASFACLPENLRLGNAVKVFTHPDRVVVGIRTEEDKVHIARLLTPFTNNIIWMSVESAEMTKHAINAFLATSVVFANEIAAICEMVGADAKEVESGLKSEQRIGPKAYLSPGGAFAGGTLARDIEFLKMVSQGHQLSIPLLESVKTSNDMHKSWVRRKLKALLPRLDGVVVVVWGLTYKPGTDTLRRSLAVELCDWLIEQGARVRVHDPVVEELPTKWHGIVQRFDEALGALEGAQVLLVGTEWPEYREILKDCVVGAAPGLVVLDPNRFLSSLGTATALRYVAVGTPSIERLA